MTPPKRPRLISRITWITTAIYNYRSGFRMPADLLDDETRKMMPGWDVYERLDIYYTSVVQELLAEAAADTVALVQHLVPTYTRYTAGAARLRRVLYYLERTFIKKAVFKGRGWLACGDINMNEWMRADHWQLNVKANYGDLVTAKLKKWGWEKGEPQDILALAESCAEAASGSNCIIPLASLARRRFRAQVLEPLLGPDANMSAKQGEGGPSGSEGRLESAVKELIESTDGAGKEKIRLAKDVAHMLKTCGVQPDHPVRKRLDDHIGMKTYRAPADA
ncbi:hypothetical protein EVG20_g2206 [Dentipellis fragilis]|uniref:Uncharacterized protein n=1 Tax=Dentipellis fragilis TaxID=205917 RepID=A0A4Y9Z7E4_9AGAM|nr:hypothetical protein EVG20_g2206 [Dentipellis fragilis]